MWATVQRLAGLSGLILLLAAFVAGLSGLATLGWYLVAVASFLFALSIFTGSRGLLRD